MNAQTELALAYGDAIALSSPTPVAALGAPLLGQSLGLGLYQHGSGLGLTGTLTRDAGGDPDAVFISGRGPR